ncbi:hypothetical protein [Qipengyuania aquimaris]|uniref:Uncharacterized protein n=1 Tax=Qipengyuania aquimaris TaxID=255984 RepID=A0A9Q3S2A0_9SPHN|nr:hypothetical protein [Qipengyuania aquimaris]MBY6218909.1 hypothetical protein [Qipengyuania aquimaris]
MGEYAPEDQRTIHKNAGPEHSMSDWHEIEKSERQRQHEQQEVQSQQGEAQRGYGNARDEDGQMEQDIATASLGEQPLAQGDASTGTAQPGEISSRPDERAAADANRPLGSS